jgi:uncharacterized protein (TIGR02246 family)
MPVVSNYRYLVRKFAPIVLIVLLISGRIAFGASESDASIIEQNYNAWVQVTNARDLELWSSYLAPDASFMPPDAALLDTRDAILDYYRKAFADPHFSLDCQQLSVDVAQSRDMAWASGECKATFTGMDGEKASGTSRWFKVWLKQADGSWKCRVNTWDNIN